jgi:hypothetical protein
MDVQTCPDDTRLPTPSSAGLEPDQGMALDSDGLAEKAVGQSVARLSTSRGSGVE